MNKQYCAAAACCGQCGTDTGDTAAGNDEIVCRCTRLGFRTYMAPSEFCKFRAAVGRAGFVGGRNIYGVASSVKAGKIVQRETVSAGRQADGPALCQCQSELSVPRISGRSRPSTRILNLPACKRPQGAVQSRVRAQKVYCPDKGA